MRTTIDPRRLILLLLVAALAGCGDEQIISPAGAIDPGQPLFAKTTLVCDVIDFDNFEHGDVVTTVSALGMTLSVEGHLWLASERPGMVTRLRAYDTNTIGGPDHDLEWQGPGATCPGCEGQGRVLVLEDARGWDDHGDDRTGGQITFSGFTSPVFVKSWTAFDNSTVEEPFFMEVHDGHDWILVSQSTQQGNGSVEVVPSPQTLFDASVRFTLGREGSTATGSGAIDDLVLCEVRETPGDDGCTIGYWKTHSSLAPGNQLDAWIATGYQVTTLLTAVFTIPAGLSDLDGNGAPDTLYDALNFTGGPQVQGGARILLRQAVAALLNASHPEVAYALTPAQVITAVNNALASGNRATMIGLAEQLDTLNNEGCPLD
jgi:hypothetical protein